MEAGGDAPTLKETLARLNALLDKPVYDEDDRAEIAVAPDRPRPRFGR